eukprot:5361597-Lingulodinium_polyedra.AAC.1
MDYCVGIAQTTKTTRKNARCMGADYDNDNARQYTPHNYAYAHARARPTCNNMLRITDRANTN